MAKTKIEFNETRRFERSGFTGNVYVEKEQAKGFQVLLITVNGAHPKKAMEGDTTRTYFVVSGKGEFIIDDEKKEAKTGDLFVIEPGHQYEYHSHGEMVLLETNISPSNSFKERLIEALK